MASLVLYVALVGKLKLRTTCAAAGKPSRHPAGTAGRCRWVQTAWAAPRGPQALPTGLAGTGIRPPGWSRQEHERAEAACGGGSVVHHCPARACFLLGKKMECQGRGRHMWAGTCGQAAAAAAPHLQHAFAVQVVIDAGLQLGGDGLREGSAGGAGQASRVGSWAMVCTNRFFVFSCYTGNDRRQQPTVRCAL